VIVVGRVLIASLLILTLAPRARSATPTDEAQLSLIGGSTSRTRGALRALEGLPQSRAIQRNFDVLKRRAPKRGPPWFRGKDAKVSVRTNREPPAGVTLLSVTASRVEGNGAERRLVLVNEPEQGTELFPTGAIRLDETDSVQILFDGQDDASVDGGNVEHGVVRAVDGRYVDLVGPATPVGCSL
jgi:hypothetical protein